MCVCVSVQSSQGNYIQSADVVKEGNPVWSLEWCVHDGLCVSVGVCEDCVFVYAPCNPVRLTFVMRCVALRVCVCVYSITGFYIA